MAAVAVLGLWLTLTVSTSLSSITGSTATTDQHDNGTSTIASTMIYGDLSTPFTTTDEIVTGAIQGDVNASAISMIADGGGGGEGGGKTPIYLGAFFSLGGEWDGSGFIPAVEMALEHVNNRTDLLADYELRMVWNNTNCEAGLGTRVLFDQIYREPQKLMILGPACSTDAQAVAETAFYWNLVTMAYSAGSPELSNRNKYPYFYRTYIPESLTNPARINLVKTYGWTRVATIYNIHELFSLTMDNLHTLLKEENVTVLTSESFSEDPLNQVINIKNHGARIIFGAMYEAEARRVFCEASKQGMIGRGYVWIFAGWYKDDWYLVDDPTVRCSRSEMIAAVEGSMYIGIEAYATNPEDQPTISGLTLSAFETLLKERMIGTQYSLNYLEPFGYDAVWAIALALNQSVLDLETKTFADGSRRRLEDFNYDDDEMAKLFFGILNLTEFTGLTGPITFSSGDRIGWTLIEQLQPGCQGPDQHLVESWCVTFVSEAKNWKTASRACAEHLGSGAVLAPFSGNLLAQSVDILRREGGRSDDHDDDWFVGHSAGSEDDLLFPSPSPSPSISSGCPAVHLDDAEESVVYVPCDNEHPYICAQPAAFLQQDVALYYTADDHVEWISELVWPGDEVPRDSRLVVEIHEGIDIHLYIAMSTLAALGIVCALIFLVFNVKFRNQKFMKLSSPNLNNLIILGSIMVYFWIFVYGIDSHMVDQHDFQSLCRFSPWVISLGFTTAYGAMFSKTWRVHRVASFNKRTPKKRIIRDSQLILLVVILLGVDIVILLFWHFLDPLMFKIVPISEMDDPEDHLVRHSLSVHVCESKHHPTFLVIIYVYKGLLLLYGTFLAWETRKVTIPALNDSKLIVICVYNVCILSGIAVGVSFALSADRAELFVFVSSIALFCTSFTLGVVFVPKMISVYKDPLGEEATGKPKRISGLESTVTTIPRTEHEGGPSRNASQGGEELRNRQDMSSDTDQQPDASNTKSKNTWDHDCGMSCYMLSCGCSWYPPCSDHKDKLRSLNRYSARSDDPEDQLDGVHVIVDAPPPGEPRHNNKTLGSSPDIERRDVTICPELTPTVNVGLKNDGFHASDVSSMSEAMSATMSPPSDTNSLQSPLSSTTCDTAEASSPTYSTTIHVNDSIVACDVTHSANGTQEVAH